MKIVRWLFWKCVYLFRGKPKDLDAWIVQAQRTRSPWWKFEPHVWYNKDGRQWEVWFSGDRCYSKNGVLPVTAHISTKDGTITGLTIRQSELYVKKDGD